MKVQAVLQLQSGALWHLVACTNPVWFQLDLPPSALHAWSESTDIEPQRHINKIEAIVPAISLCTWPKLICGSLWLHFIDYEVLWPALSLVTQTTAHLALLLTTLERSFLPWVAGHRSRGCPRNATSSLVCLGEISPLHRRTWVRDSAQLPEPLLDLTPAPS